MTAHDRSTDWYSYTSSTQTMKTWVRRLNSRDEIPELFRPEFPDQGESFPYTLFIPEDRFSLFHKRHAKILCLYDDRFLLLEAERGSVTTSSCPFDEILSVESSKVLLSSRLKITSVSGEVDIKYNTTNSRLIDPVIKTLRQGMSVAPAEEKGDEELSKFDYLSPVNYKYMNYARQSLFPGDTVRQIAYQPERCVDEGLSVFNMSLFKRYATSHLSILTERELILIKESKALKAEGSKLYGGVFSYIPRRHIQNLSLKPDPEHASCTMEISVGNDIRLRSEFSSDNEECSAFERRYQELHPTN